MLVPSQQTYVSICAITRSNNNVGIGFTFSQHYTPHIWVVVFPAVTVIQKLQTYLLNSMTTGSVPNNTDASWGRGHFTKPVARDKIQNRWQLPARLMWCRLEEKSFGQMSDSPANGETVIVAASKIGILSVSAPSTYRWTHTHKHKHTVLENIKPCRSK